VIHDRLKNIQAYVEALEKDRQTLYKTQLFLQQKRKEVQDENPSNPIPAESLQKTLEDAVQVSRGRFYMTHYSEKKDKDGNIIEPLVQANWMDEYIAGERDL
jgi:hypothetical protein